MTETSPRIELFFNNTTQLRQRVGLLQSHGYTKFNLVNKKADQRETLLEWTSIIRDECPTADICLHYSLKYNSVRGRNAHDLGATQLEAFIRQARDAANEILVISGGHSPSKPRPKWNTRAALEKLTARNQESKNPNLAIAFNPYLPDQSYLPDQKKELHHLQAKLKTNLVSKVYLQFGSDLKKTQEALDYLRNNFPHLTIAGSLFLPTATLLKQQKSRRWNGVYLSEAFLNNPETAQQIVVEMIRLFNEYDVELLWEAPGIRNEEDLHFLTELMVQATQPEAQDSDSAPTLTDTEDTEEQEEEDNENWEIDSQEDAWDDVSYDSMNEDLTLVQKKIHVENDAFLNNNNNNNKKPSNTSCLLLFGAHDLRLYDNLAVQHALQKHKTVVPVFLWSPTVIESGGIRAEALEVLIKDAVLNLKEELKGFQLDLVLRYAPTDVDIRKQLADLLESTQATAIYYNRDFTPHGRQVKEDRSKVLKDFPGVGHCGFQSVLLWDIDRVSLTQSFEHTYWGTLIPFLKGCEHFFGLPRRPIPPHATNALLQRARGPRKWPWSDPKLAIAEMSPKVRYDWQQPIRDAFPDMSHEGAVELMEQFFDSRNSGFRRYGYERHRADKEQATSRLSVHLRLGTLSPNELYWKHEDHPMEWEQKKVFCRRLAWRDLAYFHLRCFPNYAYMPVRVHYKNTRWVTGEEAERRLEAWKWGKTGYPILDAGMRELWITGYMQQNVRMIAASFLVEHLRVHWVKGCEWFHYTLVDADTAINAMMWQNAGKCGVDQWAFVPSPVSASQDPSGRYTKKWVPELAKLPLELVHRPWETPQVILERYGVFLGKNYPQRIVVDLDRERARAVENVVSMRKKAPYFNDERGCDVIVLPNGQATPVYTTRDYRIVNGRTLPPVDKKVDSVAERKARLLKARGQGQPVSLMPCL